ncbi:MAG: recombination mediator RecR [Candidatus Limnocylindria bacterium]
MPGPIAPVARLIEEFSRLPGVGQKTAQRLTYHVLRAPSEDARSLATALVAVKEQVAYCSTCCNITEAGVDPCAICADDRRDTRRICVVEEPLDVLAIERTAEFAGRYHVLHGAISPLDGIGPDQIRTAELVRRVGNGAVDEVILATNPNLEGEATAMYLAGLLNGKVGVVSRIARGLPVGGDLEYADDVTLIRSLQGRRQVEVG